MHERPKSDCALLLTCDARYLPYVLHLIWQVQTYCPNRQFDILLGSEVALDLPAWASDVRRIVAPAGLLPDDLPTRRLPRSTYLKLALPKLLLGQYRRILYLDADFFMESGDLDRLLRLDIGDHPVAAVRDTMNFVFPTFHAEEFKALNLPPVRYLNSGLLLMDVDAYDRDRIYDRCIAAYRETPQAVTLHDQSLLNLALYGTFAELSAAWNWQCNMSSPFVPRQFKVRLRHFIGGHKPWNDPAGHHDVRFRESYAMFFRTLLPGAPPLVPVERPDQLISLKRLVSDLIVQGKRQKVLVWNLSRFKDEWQVRL